MHWDPNVWKDECNEPALEPGCAAPVSPNWRPKHHPTMDRFSHVRRSRSGEIAAVRGVAIPKSDPSRRSLAAASKCSALNRRFVLRHKAEQFRSGCAAARNVPLIWTSRDRQAFTMCKGGRMLIFGLCRWRSDDRRAPMGSAPLCLSFSRHRCAQAKHRFQRGRSNRLHHRVLCGLLGEGHVRIRRLALDRFHRAPSMPR